MRAVLRRIASQQRVAGRALGYLSPQEFHAHQEFPGWLRTVPKDAILVC
jgi:hypothetical protein